MDWPVAVAVAVPLSTLIVTVGSFMKKPKNSNTRVKGLITRAELDKKLESIVYKDTCVEIQKRFEEGIKSIQRIVKDGFADLKEDIRSIGK